MDSNQTKGIIEGFENDFNEIVEEFSKNASDLKLTEFFEYWTEKSIDCIFANRFDPRELVEAISEMNNLLVHILTDSSNESKASHIVALYFLLCLFVKQPKRFQSKIRLTCDDIIRVESLTCEAQESYPNSDISFVWNKLKSIKAIDIVEERVIYGPSMLTCRGVKYVPDSISLQQQQSKAKDHKDSTIFLENEIEPSLLRIESIYTPYEQIKKSLNLDDYHDPTVEIVTNGTIGELLDQVKKSLDNFKSNYT